LDLLGLSKQLIAANTVSEVGTAAAVEILKPLYDLAGLDVQVLADPTQPKQQNLLGTLSGTDPHGLLLVTHLDTVDPGPLEFWTETGADPFALTKKGDRLFGLGSADTKLDALCKLFAAQQYRGQRLRRTLQLLGTHQEEVGALGARQFVRSPAFQAKFVACSEPSELQIIRAHKGYAVVDLEIEVQPTAALSGPFERLVFDGRSAHSSTPHLGINAIEMALQAVRGTPFCSLEGGSAANKVPDRCVVIRPGQVGQPGSVERPPDCRDAATAASLSQSLFDLWRQLALAQQPQVNPAFDPDRSVVNWGIARISGPRAHLTFDCRLLPGHDPEILTGTFRTRCSALAQSVGAKISIKVSRSNPAMELSEPSELLSSARRACQDVGLSDVTGVKPTNTEAGVFHRAGAEAIVFGPGRSTGNAHTANEHTFLSQMEKAIEFYRALIERLCR
jgi:acetylornithine deacetylase/succinyl-diaminopimelate desuccinylase-like protein